MNSKRRIIFTDSAIEIVAPQNPDAPGMLRGYALLWNVLSTDRGGYKVRLLPNSATFAPTTLALFHHDFKKLLGNTDNQTLRIFPDEIGVKVEIDLPDVSYARDVEELIEKKYMKGMSFAMVDAPKGTKTTEGGEVILNASAYTVDEITVTANPAFTLTSVEVADDPETEDDTGAQAASVRVAHSIQLARFRFDQIRLARAEFPRQCRA